MTRAVTNIGFANHIRFVGCLPARRPLEGHGSPMAGDGVGAPSGTVTFLMSDVVGSTRLWATDADAMAASLRIHDEVFRSTVAEHGGYVFSTAGDSFAVAFTRPSEGAACADALLTRLAVAQESADPVLEVRLGLHLGESEERDGDYFGPIVNLAARVMAAAHGGQCLMTRSVAEAAGMSAIDLGAHALRDIEAPVHLFQLGEAEFPQLASTAGLVVLPSPRTSLVGRDEAVAHVRRLLGSTRLVALTGVGGCGKTRLAIEVARREVATFPEGVWFVDLAAVTDEAVVYTAFATATGVMVTDRASATAQLIAYFVPRAALLVVDNCEHVIDEAAALIDDLLRACPRLRCWQRAAKHSRWTASMPGRCRHSPPMVRRRRTCSSIGHGRPAQSWSMTSRPGR